ncbi:uncharacterized protein G2W53_037947 [Senna tora]|uniref:Uncharacterized protein n=1 Tax=Senna tora TaxID=362788 RepID=A0A834SLM5_9FABA|nr:uncharacterized protein G2W53_037947 [Senna tora]
MATERIDSTENTTFKKFKASSPVRRENNSDKRIDSSEITTPVGCPNPSGEKNLLDPSISIGEKK